MTSDRTSTFALSISLLIIAFRFIPVRGLHVAALVIGCLALSSPGGDSTTNYIETEAGIRWPPFPKSVQKGELALIGLNLGIDLVLTILYFWLGSKINKDTNDHRFKNLPFKVRAIAFTIGLWNAGSLVGWIICLYDQSKYLPYLGKTDLELCVAHPNKTQCKMVTATWILGIIFCIDHFVMILCAMGGIKTLWPESSKPARWRGQRLDEVALGPVESERIQKSHN